MQTTFDAQVVNGQLQHLALRPYEGQQVRVTLALVLPAEQQAGKDESPASEEPPEDMDVEKDVYVKMPFQTEILEGVRVVEGRPLEPSGILPEELPDD